MSPRPVASVSYETATVSTEHVHDKANFIDELLVILRRIVDGFICIVTCGCCEGPNGAFRSGDIYETELMEGERQAVHNLLHYIEFEMTDNSMINDERLRALCILTYSDNSELQRSAALCYVEFSQRMRAPLTAVLVEPLMVLIRSGDLQVQKAVSLAVSNFIINGPDSNKDVLMASGIVQPLSTLLSSRSIEVQCNTCGCITTLATSDANKAALVKSGIIRPLLRLCKSSDVRVQRNASGAVLNLTHIQSNRNDLVARGAIPTLVESLHSKDTDVQYYSAAALSNMAVNEKHRTMMAAVGYHDVIKRLVLLLSSTSYKVQCQSCLALRNLASDADHQLLIVREHSLPPLHTLIKESNGNTLAAGLACLRNLSLHKSNESAVISENMVPTLMRQLRISSNPQAQQHAAGIIRNLATGDHITDVLTTECANTMAYMLLDPSTNITVLIEVTASIAVFADDDETKDQLMNMEGGKVFSRLVSLASLSSNSEVQYNCAGAIGQIALTVKLQQKDIPEDLLHKNIAGILLYLDKFLMSPEPSFVHVALWTLLQLLDDRGFYSIYKKEVHLHKVIEKIVKSKHSEAIKELADNVQAKMTAQAMSG